MSLVKEMEASTLELAMGKIQSMAADMENLKMALEAATTEITLLKQSQFPDELSDPLREVLSLICFQCGSFAAIYRGAGIDIKTKAEDEQAFIIHRFTKLVLKHGADWRKFAEADIREHHSTMVGKHT